jgi:hypothetical protein
MIVIFGFIAAIVGSLLIGYSFGLRAGMRDPLVGDTRSIESEAAQNVNRSVDPVADLRDVLFRNLRRTANEQLQKRLMRSSWKIQAIASQPSGIIWTSPRPWIL